MKKEFVTYDQAKELFDLGFRSDFILRGFMSLYGEIILTDTIYDGHYILEAPLKSQVYRWFREVTDWDFAIIKEFNDNDYPYYFYILFADTAGLNKHCKNYEEAELLLINELIENYKELNNGSI